MQIINAVVLVTVSGMRQSDGTLLIDNSPYCKFPEEITVEGKRFDFSDEEECDAESGYWLAHYFNRDEERPRKA
jgi:hypothetical protein